MAVALAINQLTNRIYIGNFAEGANGTVTVINRVDNATSTVDVKALPSDVAVNQVTNKIYVGNSGNSDMETSNNVTVINGADNSVLASFDIGGDHASIAIAIDSLLNTIYVANDSTNQVTVISGN